MTGRLNVLGRSAPPESTRPGTAGQVSNRNRVSQLVGTGTATRPRKAAVVDAICADAAFPAHGRFPVTWLFAVVGEERVDPTLDLA